MKFIVWLYAIFGSAGFLLYYMAGDPRVIAFVSGPLFVLMLFAPAVLALLVASSLGMLSREP